MQRIGKQIYEKILRNRKKLAKKKEKEAMA